MLNTKVDSTLCTTIVYTILIYFLFFYRGLQQAIANITEMDMEYITLTSSVSVLQIIRLWHKKYRPEKHYEEQEPPSHHKQHKSLVSIKYMTREQELCEGDCFIS